MIIIVFGAASMKRRDFVESFEQEIDLKPDCTVYFTENISACDGPKDVDGVRIDFSYHRKYYENLKEDLEKRQADVGNLTEAEAKQYATLIQVLKQYDNMLDGQSCKMTIPNWKQITDHSNDVTLGNIEQNAQRGNSRQWAFCLTDATTDVEVLDESGFDIEKNQDGSVYAINHQGKQYARGAFPNFNLETMKNIYCRATSSQTTELFTGIQIDPFAFTMKVIKNSEVQNMLDQTIVNGFINANLIIEDVVVHGNKEEVYMKSNPLVMPVYQINRDICGRETIVLTNARLSLQLANLNNPIKVVSIDEANVLGTRADLTARRTELVVERNKVVIERDKAKPLKDLRDTVQKSVIDEETYLLREKVKWENKLNNKKKSKAETATASLSALVAVPGLGVLAGLANAFAAIGLAAKRAADRKKWKNNLKKVNRRLNILQNDCKTQVCDYAKSLCIDEKSCPRVLTMMNTYVNQANNVYNPLNDQVIAYDAKIKQIDDQLKLMNDNILQFITTTIQSGSFSISDPPYEALSWDNKFYIVL